MKSDDSRDVPTLQTDAIDQDQQSRQVISRPLLDQKVVALLQKQTLEAMRELSNALNSDAGIAVGVSLEDEIAQLKYVSATGNVSELNRYFLGTADEKKVVRALRGLMDIRGRKISKQHWALIRGGESAATEALQESKGLLGDIRFDAKSNTIIITNAGNELFVIRGESLDGLSLLVVKAILDSLAARHAIVEALPNRQAVPTTMEKLYATDRVMMMEGLKSRIDSVENASGHARLEQVYDVFKPYIEGKELPPGTTPQVMRFLIISAGVPGLWQRLDEVDPRLGDALLGCYAEGLGMTKLAEILPEVHNPAMAGYLVGRGLKKLFEWMPEQSADFPIDKHVVFPLEELLTTRKERQRAAGKKSAEGKNTSEWGRKTVARRWG